MGKNSHEDRVKSKVIQFDWQVPVECILLQTMVLVSTESPEIYP